MHLIEASICARVGVGYAVTVKVARRQRWGAGRRRRVRAGIRVVRVLAVNAPARVAFLAGRARPLRKPVAPVAFADVISGRALVASPPAAEFGVVARIIRIFSLSARRLSVAVPHVISGSQRRWRPGRGGGRRRGRHRDLVDEGRRRRRRRRQRGRRGRRRRVRGRRQLGRQLGRICCGPDARDIQRSRPPPVRVVVTAVQVWTGGADRTDQVVHAGRHRALIIARLTEGQKSRMGAELDVGLAGAGARLFHQCNLLFKVMIVGGVFAKTKAVRLLTCWHKSRRLQASSGSDRKRWRRKQRVCDRGRRCRLRNRRRGWWRWTREVSLHNSGG